MIRDKNFNLLIKPLSGSVYQYITAEKAGWAALNFAARVLRENGKWSGYTGNSEYGLTLLSGNLKVRTDKGEISTTNGRKDVFSGIAHSIYIPINTEFEVIATSELLDVAYGWVKTEEEFPLQLRRPEDARVEIRGGENASRQINHLIYPGFECSRIVTCEVYTPAGNWSSFPAHKHDERIINDNNELIEAELAETYFYKFAKPQGFAVQRVYTSDHELNETAVTSNNDVVLVPKGYHPVSAGHGYNTYYLNYLAGSDQSLACSMDPDHDWINGTWKFIDKRVPMVKKEMNTESL